MNKSDFFVVVLCGIGVGLNDADGSLPSLDVFSLLTLVAPPINLLTLASSFYLCVLVQPMGACASPHADS